MTETTHRTRRIATNYVIVQKGFTVKDQILERYNLWTGSGYSHNIDDAMRFSTEQEARNYRDENKIDAIVMGNSFFIN